jgi:UDP-glucose 4-epimerase
MRILLTGASGFIGSHLLAHLQEHSVVALTRSPLQKVEPHVTNVVATHSDSEALRAALRGCDSVLHLAAQSNAQRAAADPAECIDSNVTFTTRLAHLAALEEVPHFVFTSSALIYGTPSVVPITENTPPEPTGMYAASKLAAEVVLQQLHPHVSVLRLFNVFGPGQTGTLIPALIEQFSDGKQPTLQGDGSQVRSFLFVNDCADALRLAVEARHTGTLNIAGHKASILDVTRHVAHSMGVVPDPSFGPSRPNDAPENWASHQAALDALGWSPSTQLAAGIALTV